MSLPRSNVGEGWLTTFVAMYRAWKAMQPAENVAVSRKSKVTMRAAPVSKIK